MTRTKPAGTAVYTWLVMMKAYKSLARHAERSIAALGMCFSDFRILEALLQKGPQPVAELGRRVELTSGAMTTAIDRLEKRALVARTDHATDRRAWLIHLTDEGESLISRVFASHTDAMERAMGGLSKAERATLASLLKRLGTTAEQQFIQEGSQS